MGAFYIDYFVYSRTQLAINAVKAHMSSISIDINSESVTPVIDLNLPQSLNSIVGAYKRR